MNNVQIATIHAEKLLARSRELPRKLGSSGIRQVVNGLCTRNGIDTVPALRLGRNYDAVEKGNFALVDHNALIFNPEALRLELMELRGLVAHKLGHLVLRHKGEAAKSGGVVARMGTLLGHDKPALHFDKKADRFAKFLLKNDEPLEEYLQMRKDVAGDIFELMQRERGVGERIKDRLFPAFAESSEVDMRRRLKNIWPRTTKAEAREFTDAIAAHNERWKSRQGQPVGREEMAHAAVSAAQEINDKMRIWAETASRGTGGPSLA